MTLVPLTSTGSNCFPKLAVGSGNFSAKPMSFAIARPGQPLRGVSCQDRIVRLRRDILTVLDPDNLPAHNGVYVCFEVEALALCSSERIACVSDLVAQTRRHLE